MKPARTKSSLTEEVPGRRWSVRVGSCSAKVYATVNRGKSAYLVACWANGKRRQDMRYSLLDAITRAEQLAGDIDKGRVGNATLSVSDVASFSRAQAALPGMPLDLAALQLAEALNKLGGRSLLEAVDYFTRHNPGQTRDTVAGVRDKFLAARRADRRGHRHLKDLTLRLGLFAEAFDCSIASVTTSAISEWLRGLDCDGRSRNNYRAAVRNMFRWAGGQGMIAPDQINWQEDNGVALATEKQGKIEIYTPDELRALIKAASMGLDGLPAGFNRRYVSRQGLLPLLVLGAFAGLRTSEVQAQLWSDIDIDRGYLRVTETKGNTPARRLVPIPPNLAAWLRVCKRTAETCCDYARPEDVIARLAARAKMEWKRNSLRHSFVSYRVALTQDVPKVALEAGNSPRKIHSNYLELVTPEQAREWFAIVPTAN